MCVEEKTEVPIFISRWTIDLARDGMKDVAGILARGGIGAAVVHGSGADGRGPRRERS